MTNLQQFDITEKLPEIEEGLFLELVSKNPEDYKNDLDKYILDFGLHNSSQKKLIKLESFF